MIDWLGVGGNALWILGLALVLAAWSYQCSRMSRRSASAAPDAGDIAVGAWARLGAILVCLGLAVSSTSTLERTLWVLVALCVVAERLSRRVGRHRELDADRSV